MASLSKNVFENEQNLAEWEAQQAGEFWNSFEHDHTVTYTATRATLFMVKIMGFYARKIFTQLVLLNRNVESLRKTQWAQHKNRSL